MGISFQNIEFYSGPQFLKSHSKKNGSDNIEDIIIDFINGAQKKLEVSVQQIDSEAIAQSIVKARLRRKVVVKLVIDGDSLGVVSPPHDPFKPSVKLKNEANRMIYNAFLRSKVWVRADFSSDSFCQKFIIRDGQSVMICSSNFNATDLSETLSHVLIIHDKRVAQLYRQEFLQIQKGNLGRLNLNLPKTPPELSVSNMRLKFCYAPDHAPELEIIKQMLKAKKRVDFVLPSFAESSAFDDVIDVLSQRGIAITGCIECKSLAKKDKIKSLISKNNNQFKLHSLMPKHGIQHIHQKLIVIDNHVVIIGGQDPHDTFCRLNDENLLVVGQIQSKSLSQKKFALYIRQEIERLVLLHG